MAIHTRLIEFQNEDAVFEGFLAWDDQFGGPQPGVMIAHTIAGRTAFEERKAMELAELGYVGFAIDVYGKGTQTEEIDVNRDRMTKLRDDRPLLQRHLRAALQTLREQSEVDESKVAAIGFCFGGLCVLDIARCGEEIAGVASFHGILSPPGNTLDNKIQAKVLVLHGWDDPLAKPDEVVALAEELTSMQADWQLHGYGNTMHAFTNPAAAVPEQGKNYNESADRRSWTAMRVFLAELFD
ncbi:MAG: dienelactone hydrolase family protein [Woeseiaceae bacterium]